jgi:dihydrodipicolinate synthase/N-acetylneuraminate lyase
MMQAKDFQGLYAIIATPAKPGAERLAATDTVDMDETVRLINALIRDGASGLIALGTTGECATLSEPDYEAFTACVLETVNRRVPTFIGATGLSGHQVVRRLRRLQDLGVEGTLLGLPMWQPMTTDMAVDWYADVSRLFPELALMVYANARAFRHPFGADFWTALAKVAPTATSAKHSRTKDLRELLDATQQKIQFMPSDMAVDQFHAISPSTTTACWATAAGMGPKPSIALMKALKSGDEDSARELAAAIAWANAPILPLVNNPEVFAQYNIQMEKTRINAAGYSTCGPNRPPYQRFPEPYHGQAVAAGKRWAQLDAAVAGGLVLKPWRD